jgi:hypothetical protein
LAAAASAAGDSRATAAGDRSATAISGVSEAVAGARSGRSLAVGSLVRERGAGAHARRGEGEARRN